MLENLWLVGSIFLDFGDSSVYAAKAASARREARRAPGSVEVLHQTRGWRVKLKPPGG